MLAAIEPFVYEFTQSKGGSISAEHGLGVMKAEKIVGRLAPDCLAISGCTYSQRGELDRTYSYDATSARSQPSRNTANGPMGHVTSTRSSCASRPIQHEWSGAPLTQQHTHYVLAAALFAIRPGSQADAVDQRSQSLDLTTQFFSSHTRDHSILPLFLLISPAWFSDENELYCGPFCRRDGPQRHPQSVQDAAVAGLSLQLAI